jgi:hypothetical protein
VNTNLHRASPRTPGGGKANSLPPPGVRGLKWCEYHYYHQKMSYYRFYSDNFFMFDLLIFFVYNIKKAPEFS